MDFSAFPPIAAVLDGAHAMLMALSRLLEPIIGVSSAAAAVVLVTLLVRAALIPVGISQAKAECSRARLAPRLAELRRRYGTDPERLRRETMALYSDEGVSPFVGCLPMLIQAPVVSVISALFILPTIAGHPNELLTRTLLGVPLDSSLAGAIVSGALAPAGFLVLGCVVVGIALVGDVTRRVFRARPSEGQRTLGLLQFITAAIAVFMPLASALHLLVTVAWTLGQRMLLRRAYPLPPGLPA